MARKSTASSSSPSSSACGRFGQAAFGVAHGGGVIAIDIAEIALPVDQRIAHAKILRQAHQRVIDRLIAMGMDTCRSRRPPRWADFLKPAPGLSRSSRMRVQHAAMHRLQPVAHIGQRALGDGGQRIGEIALGQRLAQRFGTDFVG